MTTIHMCSSQNLLEIYPLIQKQGWLDLNFNFETSANKKQFICRFKLVNGNLCLTILIVNLLLLSANDVFTRKLIDIQIRAFSEVVEKLWYYVKSIRFGSVSGPYFPAFEMTDTRSYFAVFRPNTGKYGSERLRIRKCLRSVKVLY